MKHTWYGCSRNWFLLSECSKIYRGNLLYLEMDRKLAASLQLLFLLPLGACYSWLWVLFARPVHFVPVQ
jgi:hypothetical protein